jgi:hypothetical protein
VNLAALAVATVLAAAAPPKAPAPKKGASPGKGPPAKRVVKLMNPRGQAGLTRLNKHTCIYSFANDQAWVQFSFGKRPFDAKLPLREVRKQFKYANLEVRFPERKGTTSRAYCQLLSPIRTLDKPLDSRRMKGVKLTITGCDGRRLRGTFTGTITQITTREEGPGLRTGDIAGVGHTSEKANVPFVVTFDLSVPAE